MSLTTLSDDFVQARAILRDADFKATADRNKKETIAMLRLLEARENNTEFELELAERICGDNPLYPYRSSRFLTRFFQDIGLNYTHDGSTRRYWVMAVLVELDITQIANLIERGLFKKKDYENLPPQTSDNRKISSDEFFDGATRDFTNFIDESIRANEHADISQILGLNPNIQLLFNSKAETTDDELNQLINEARERFLKPGDKYVALEKLWDAFERMKTYYANDKKKSANTLIEKISTDLDTNIFSEEFNILTEIGNKYRIRHHEKNAKSISDGSQIDYFFFRMLALIALVLDKLKHKDK